MGRNFLLGSETKHEDVDSLARPAHVIHFVRIYRRQFGANHFAPVDHFCVRAYSAAMHLTEGYTPPLRVNVFFFFFSIDMHSDTKGEIERTNGQSFFFFIHPKGTRTLSKFVRTLCYCGLIWSAFSFFFFSPFKHYKHLISVNAINAVNTSNVPRNLLTLLTMLTQSSFKKKN